MTDSLETKFTSGSKLSAMTTQREMYAAMFLQAILSREKAILTDSEKVWVAVNYADDLIEELEKVK